MKKLFARIAKVSLLAAALIGLGMPLHAQSNGSRKKAEKIMAQANGAFDMGDFKKALSLAEKASSTDKSYSDPYALQAAIYEYFKDSGQAMEAHRQCIAADPLYQPAYYFAASYLFQLGRLDESQSYMDAMKVAAEIDGYNPSDHAGSRGMQARMVRLQEGLDMAMSDFMQVKDLAIENLGNKVNSKGHEYWPGLSIDSRTLVFTRLVDMQEDFYVSYWQQGDWTSARPAPGDMNTNENEGTTAMSSDGRTLIYTVCNQGGYGSCDLFVSRLVPNPNGPDRWSARENLGPVINSRSWDAQPSLSGDGHTLVFASARPGGLGGKDLWMSTLQNGRWTEPKNLGAPINTTGDEEAPFLHYDGMTLYFSSDGHPGYGQKDLFVSRRTAGLSWSEPQNLGLGLNTPKDDIGIYIDAKAESGLFASDREGGEGGLDIYRFHVPQTLKPMAVTYVQARIFNRITGQPLAARLGLVEVAAKRTLLTDSTEQVLVPLVPGGNYAWNAYADGFMFQSLNFQPTAQGLDSPFVVDIFLEPVVVNQRLVLENIFFDTDKSNLKPESEVELARVMDWLNQNPKLHIEISGHTDSEGSEDYNLELSNRRAGTVAGYLIEQGVNAQRIQFKGYGETQPIASNETEQGRAKNRRIEMKIINL